jgi:mono/diheme cytochrome c family protein
MKPCIPALLLLFAAWAPAAQAQQADNLNTTQVLGRRILAQSCGVCHLHPVRNSVTYAPPLAKTTDAGNDEAMRAIIANGTDHMPGFKYYLKPAEIDAVIAYVRTVAAPTAPAKTQTPMEKSDD